jgi:hypothetical protein
MKLKNIDEHPAPETRNGKLLQTDYYTIELQQNTTYPRTDHGNQGTMISS